MAFTAEVLSSGQGGGHAIVVPKEVAAAFGSKRPQILAHVNGVEYRSRLMVYGGQSYLGLRKDLLRQLQVEAGDQVQIELVEDLQERVVVEPPELTQALAENPAAQAAYQKLPSHIAMSTPSGSTRARNPRPAPTALPRQSSD
jgi:antitoxin component of MazEF toxin-antitoxin module